MLSLRELQHDEGIPGDQVYVLGDGGLELLDKPAAITQAHALGKHLLAERPVRPGEGPAVCAVTTLRLPLAWEDHDGPAEPGTGGVPDHDPELWFEASCGGRDVLLGNAHTFVGRMSAWCPRERVSYNVSLSELGEMSVPARYWVRGFLHGAEPDEPEYDPPSQLPAEELAAWEAALAQFRRTGDWSASYRACPSCGRVLFPGNITGGCERHPSAAG